MLCYTAKGNKVADEIKVANKLTLRWQDDPGLAGWTQSNHRSPYTWKREAEKREPERWQLEKEVVQCCWLWGWESWAMSQGM